EFMREKTYFSELCLVQIATRDVVACVDPLALEDCSALYELIYDTAKLKVLHSGRQDLELFFATPGGVVQPLFDTQIAAGLVGHAPQIGYGPLVEALLGVSLAKGQTRTNWKRRPLSAAQTEYAADDVRYLLEVYDMLRDALEAADRLTWAEHDSQRLADPALYTTDPLEAWRRVKRAGVLRPEERRKLVALAAWRETAAMRRNLPRRWVLADDALVALAQGPASSVEELKRIPGVSAKLAQRHGSALLTAINEVAPTLPMPPEPRPRPSQAEKDQVRRLATRARGAAEGLGIDPSLLATQRELQALVAGERALSVLTGWRREAVGEQLLGDLDSR
ncbi:MAG: ribonuclease D, partial [Pseudomonadota bacterium]